MRTSVKFLIVAGAAAGAAAVATRQWWRTWGRLPELEGETLPGDEIVPAPTTTDTRAIEIDAPPSAVWPWLVQMGYGRAGWYSYDTMDKRTPNVDTIVDEWQDLKVGDTMPFQSIGGFEVAALDPERTLVLRIDTAIAVAQAKAAAAATTDDAGSEEAGPTEAGATELDEATSTALSAPGGLLSSNPPEFSGSWTFVLEPMDGGRTRLVERIRFWFGDMGGRDVSRGAPFLGFGAFVVLQRHMLGVRGRAERLVHEGGTGEAAPAGPAPDAVTSGA